MSGECENCGNGQNGKEQFVLFDDPERRSKFISEAARRELRGLMPLAAVRFNTGFLIFSLDNPATHGVVKVSPSLVVAAIGREGTVWKEGIKAAGGFAANFRLGKNLEKIDSPETNDVFWSDTLARIYGSRAEADRYLPSIFTEIALFKRFPLDPNEREASIKRDPPIRYRHFDGSACRHKTFVVIGGGNYCQHHPLGFVVKETDKEGRPVKYKRINDPGPQVEGLHQEEEQPQKHLIEDELEKRVNAGVLSGNESREMVLGMMRDIFTRLRLVKHYSVITFIFNARDLGKEELFPLTS